MKYVSQGDGQDLGIERGTNHWTLLSATRTVHWGG